MIGVYAITPAGIICIGIGLAMGITVAIGTDAACVGAADACEWIPRASAFDFPINASVAASGAAAVTGVIIDGSAISQNRIGRRVVWHGRRRGHSTVAP